MAAARTVYLQASGKPMVAVAGLEPADSTFPGDVLPGTPPGAVVEDVFTSGLTVADTGRATFFVMLENAPAGDDFGLFANGGWSPPLALAMAGCS